MRFEDMKTGKAPVEAEIVFFEFFRVSCFEPGRDLERDTSLDDIFDALLAFLILPILL